MSFPTRGQPNVQVVGPFLSSIAPTMGARLHESNATRYSDLFVWSSLTGSERLMRLLWVRCEKPVHVALECSHLFGKMAHSPQVGMRGYLITTRGMQVPAWS